MAKLLSGDAAVAGCETLRQARVRVYLPGRASFGRGEAAAALRERLPRTSLAGLFTVRVRVYVPDMYIQRPRDVREDLRNTRQAVLEARLVGNQSPGATAMEMFRVAAAIH